MTKTPFLQKRASVTIEELAGFVGEKWPDFRRDFTRFHRDERARKTWEDLGYVASSGLWILYRKMYRQALLMELIGFLIAAAVVALLYLTKDAFPRWPFIVCFLLLSLYLNRQSPKYVRYMYYRHAITEIHKAKRKYPGEDPLALCRKIGGTSYKGLVIFASPIILGFAAFMALFLYQRLKGF